MKQETDNAKMHGRENLIYIPVSRSLPVRMDRHGTKRYQGKCLQSLVYNTKNTYPEVDNSNIETSDKNMFYGIHNLKKRNPKVQYVQRTT
jgi:hypothetical protein